MNLIQPLQQFNIKAHRRNRNIIVALIMVSLVVSSFGVTIEPASAQPVLTKMNGLSQMANSPAQATLTTGDGTWKWQNPVAQGNSINGLSCPGDLTCYAAGNAGTLLKTSD